MKRQITRLAPTSWIRRGVSLIALAVGLSASPAFAQGKPAPNGGGEGSDILQGTQGPGFGRPTANDQELDFNLASEFPGLARITRRESESELFERFRQEAKGKSGTGRVFFPQYTPITREPFQPRRFPLMVETVEPLAVQHGRLYFEQPNFERQGWNLGILTPAVNLGVFYYDVAMFPYHFWTRPCDRCDSSAGKCLPGDPTPLFLYREEFSWTGLAGQSATVLGGFFIFP